MPKRLSTLSVALTSLALTYLFFSEYLSPFRKVYVPFDLWGYHYPLMDYAFQTLKHHSFPAWDPSIYSGQPFAANIQAALFYPPTWILYALNAAHDHLSYRALEAFVFAHIWLAFLLSFCWLRNKPRNKRISDLACILGAAIFAFSGYAMLQLQHQGLLCAYAWLPLGLWGIDDNRTWPGFLKIAIASAAAFLAGYPPTWLVLAIYWTIYALFSRKLTRTAFALLASLTLAAIQLLPTIEASSLMMKENRYGQPIREISFYLSYLIPNLYDFGIDVPATTNFGHEYLYLGAPALFGIAIFLRYPRWRPVLPLLTCGAVCLIFLTDPFHAISTMVAKIPILAEVCGAWYFLAGLTATAAGVAAFGIDQFLTATAKPVARIWTIAAIISAIAWATYELHLWSVSAFRPGAWSALDALATLLIFALCIFVARTHKPIAAVLLLCAAIDYKSFGTSKRFNANKGSLPHEYARDGFFAMDPRAFQALAAHREYRILLDPTAPMPAELRHHALASPQGFDPFVAQRYLDFVKTLGAHADTDREFSFDPGNQIALDILAIRYVITTPNGPNYRQLEANPAFKLLGNDGYYFRVYEYQKFSKPYIGPAMLLSRTPESRRFQTASPVNTEFMLKEQLFPGWTASLDGMPIPIHLWHGAFQSVQLPAGNHKLDFHYEPRALRLGAWISAASVSLLAAISLRMASRRYRSQ